eukprot:5915776-Pleurochrysis_carterae.AAC.1
MLQKQLQRNGIVPRVGKIKQAGAEHAFGPGAGRQIVGAEAGSMVVGGLQRCSVLSASYFRRCASARDSANARALRL